MRTSYVYVKDVARVISAVLSDRSILDEVYNVGFDEPKSLEELLIAMGKTGLGLSEENLKDKFTAGEKKCPHRRARKGYCPLFSF